MEPLITIKYKKGFGYYLNIIFLSAFIIFFSILSFGGLYLGEFASLIILPIAFIFLHMLYVFVSFKEITISKDIVIINGVTYNSKEVRFRYYNPKKTGILMCDIEHSGMRVCKYMHSSLLMGRITGTNPKRILEVIDRIRKDIELPRFIDHSPNIKRDREDCTISIIILILLLCYLFIIYGIIFFISHQLHHGS